VEGILQREEAVLLRSRTRGLFRVASKEPRQPRSPTTKAVDGSRTWIVENAQQAGTSEDDQDWKARLRSMIDS